jgi:hypothetical protein
VTYSGIATFAGSAIQITSVVTEPNGQSFPPGAAAKRILIEPLRANTHQAYVGLSNVTNNGTGVAIQELSIPAAGVALDRFDLRSPGTYHNYDPSIFYVHGFTTEKVKITIDVQ